GWWCGGGGALDVVGVAAVVVWWEGDNEGGRRLFSRSCGGDEVRMVVCWKWGDVVVDGVTMVTIVLVGFGDRDGDGVKVMMVGVCRLLVTDEGGGRRNSAGSCWGGVGKWLGRRGSS
nr:hypothetical protein [Tanacetum cinerariifolium]